MFPRSMLNREEILRSEMCGCFHCRSTFAPDEIAGWTDERDGVGQTPLCPRCGVDSVVGSASGFPVTSPDFLAEMHARAFG
jgi:hypothetical protein